MAGPSAGRCDLKLEELGLPESLAYNEAEEDAAKKDLTATAATVAVRYVCFVVAAEGALSVFHSLTGFGFILEN